MFVVCSTAVVVEKKAKKKREIEFCHFILCKSRLKYFWAVSYDLWGRRKTAADKM